MNTLATLSRTHPIKRVASKRYTRRIFKKFQAESIASNNYMHETLKKDNDSVWYWVGHVEEEKRKWKVVHFATYDWVQVQGSWPCLRPWVFFADTICTFEEEASVGASRTLYFGSMDIERQFRTMHDGVRTSQTDGTTEIPSHAELLDLRAKVSRAYEHTKGDRSDVSILGDLCDQFTNRVLLRRGNPTESI